MNTSPMVIMEAKIQEDAGMRTLLRYALLLVALLILAFLAITIPRFRASTRAERERVLAGSRLLPTAEGTVEFADRGSGPPVLVVHGAGGGYDQGRFIAEHFVGTGFRFIAPSRFGYLRSPILGDGTPETQADTYAALLDRLGIQRAGVVAVSDGGPSALQFALRHPDRLNGLVMLSAKSQTPPPETALQASVFRSIFRSDYLFWVITDFMQPFLLKMFGVSGEVQSETTTFARPIVSEFLSSMNPISLRRSGIYHDRATLSTLPEARFPLERIGVPTLVIHAVDDGLQPYRHGVNTAQKVPGAEFLSYERGGHMLILQLDAVRSRVNAFLIEHVNRLHHPWGPMGSSYERTSGAFRRSQ
jgi:pimeloyl-ACP methyl ester carboxylesterase